MQGWEDRSSPMGQLPSLRAEAVPLPRELVAAKRPAVPGPVGRNTGCPRKPSSPHIRKMQYTALSVAGL